MSLRSSAERLTEPILVIAADPVAGHPAQLAVERSLRHVGREGQVLSVNLTAADVPRALAGLAVCGVSGVLVCDSSHPDRRFPAAEEAEPPLPADLPRTFYVIRSPGSGSGGSTVIDSNELDGDLDHGGGFDRHDLLDDRLLQWAGPGTRVYAPGWSLPEGLTSARRLKNSDRAILSADVANVQADRDILTPVTLYAEILRRAIGLWWGDREPPLEIINEAIEEYSAL